MTKTNRTLFPALLAAFASSLCCIAPLLSALAGIGGAAGHQGVPCASASNQ